MCPFKCSEKAMLSPCSLGIAFGAVKGLWLLGLAWAGWLAGYGLPLIEHIGEFYHSYAPSLVGGLLGGLFGFICGFIGGFIIAWIYNVTLGCCCKGCKKSPDSGNIDASK